MVNARIDTKKLKISHFRFLKIGTIKMYNSEIKPKITDSEVESIVNFARTLLTPDTPDTPVKTIEFNLNPVQCEFLLENCDFVSVKQSIW